MDDLEKFHYELKYVGYDQLFLKRETEKGQILVNPNHIETIKLLDETPPTLQLTFTSGQVVSLKV